MIGLDYTNVPDGTDGPVSEKVISEMFRIHHGPNSYNMRKGRLPAWYTKNMKYFYFVFGGKIMSATGYIEHPNYIILGGSYTHEPWRKESEFWGSPINKVFQAREPYLKNKPKIAGLKYTGKVTPKNNQKTWIEHMRKFYDIEPMDSKGIPDEMIDNFEKRYPGAWGIRKDSIDVEKMAKAMDSFSNDWWDLLKATRSERKRNWVETPDKMGNKYYNRDCFIQARRRFIRVIRKSKFAMFKPAFIELSDADLIKFMENWAVMKYEEAVQLARGGVNTTSEDVMNIVVDTQQILHRYKLCVKDKR